MTARRSERLLVVEGTLEGARKMAERRVALQVASIRERLGWFLPMMTCSFVFLAAGFRHTKSCVVLYPMIPMSFAFLYQLDFAYGHKTNRIKGIAERILSEEGHLISVPEWQYTNTHKKHESMN